MIAVPFLTQLLIFSVLISKFISHFILFLFKSLIFTLTFIFITKCHADENGVVLGFLPSIIFGNVVVDEFSFFCFVIVGFFVESSSEKEKIFIRTFYCRKYIPKGQNGRLMKNICI